MARRHGVKVTKLDEELQKLDCFENDFKPNTSKRSSKQKSRIRSAFFKMSLMALLLIVSTYAWFTSQKDITLSNLSGTVEVAENMEISLDAKTWKQEIDLSNAVGEFQDAQASRDRALGEEGNPVARTTAVAVMPSQLLPVSGVGEKSSKLMPIYTGKATTISLADIEKCEEINDYKEPVDDGFFAFDIYVKNTSQDGADDVLQLNLNSAVQVLTGTITKTTTDAHGNEISRQYIGDDASGLQNTVRVGLALYDGEVDSTSTQKEVLDATKNANIQDIAIWEPNAKDHVEYIVTNNNKLVNGLDTDTDLSFDNGEEVTTYALNENAVGTDITNVYDITTEGLGIQNTFKTDNTKDETTGEVTDYRIKSETGKPLNITNVENNEFKIKSNKISRIRVYVWLEGQDVDCINLASEGGGIELDLGLTKDDEVGDVLENSQLPLNIEYEVIDEANQEVKVTIRSEKELELPDATWNYEEIEQGASAGAVYQVASTEPVQVAATIINKKAIWKIFTGETEYNFEVKASDGSIKKVEGTLVYNPGNTTPICKNISYENVGTSKKIATISIGKEIGSLPNGWQYVDSTKMEISKEYEENIEETVTVTDTEGNEVTFDVKIEGVIIPPIEDPEGLQVLLDVVKANPKGNYGRYVNYPVEIDTNWKDYDWQIFYADNNYVYLIADDYVKTSAIQNWQYLDTIPMYTNSDCGLCFQAGLTGYEAANKLSNSPVWDLMFGDNSYAGFVMGGPTLQMWCASWNTLYPDEKIYYSGDTSGYLVGNIENPTAPDLDISSYAGYNNTMYVSRINSDGVFGYRLASPSASQNDCTMVINSNGIVQPNGAENPNLGLRPVVCLNSDVKATLNGNVWVLLPEPETLVDAVKADKKANYGRRINYPVDIDADTKGNPGANPTDSDWQIFYADEDYVYIIADFYVPNSMITDSALSATGLRIGNNYGRYGVSLNGSSLQDNITNTKYTLDVNNKYMLSRASSFTTNTNPSYQIAGGLLDTDVWKGIFANNSYAVDAVAAPTIEMWADSWNTVYENYSGEQIYINTGTSGYYVGTEENATTKAVEVKDFAGANNKMYFSEQIGNTTVKGYWLAAPTAGGTGLTYSTSKDPWNTQIRNNVSDMPLGIRPVVCLNSDLKASFNPKTNEWVINGN